MKYMLIGPRECFFLTLQNNTRHPQQNEMIRDRWVGRSWGWHKVIHHGLIHSLVTLSPNVSEQFYTLPWYAGSRPRLHSRESKRQRHHWLPLRARAAAVFPQRFLAVTAGSDKHEPSRISTTDESEIVPRGELSCTNSNPVLPDDYRLVQPRVSALIKRCRAEGCLQIWVRQSDKY